MTACTCYAYEQHGRCDHQTAPPWAEYGAMLRRIDAVLANAGHGSGPAVRGRLRNERIRAAEALVDQAVADLEVRMVSRDAVVKAIADLEAAWRLEIARQKRGAA